MYGSSHVVRINSTNHAYLKSTRQFLTRRSWKYIDRTIFSTEMNVTSLVKLLMSHHVVESIIPLSKKERHIIGAKENGANGRCIYVLRRLLPSFSVHFDSL